MYSALTRCCRKVEPFLEAIPKLLNLIAAPLWAALFLLLPFHTPGSWLRFIYEPICNSGFCRCNSIWNTCFSCLPYSPYLLCHLQRQTCLFLWDCKETAIGNNYWQTYFFCYFQTNIIKIINLLIILCKTILTNHICFKAYIISLWSPFIDNGPETVLQCHI